MTWLKPSTWSVHLFFYTTNWTIEKIYYRENEPASIWMVTVSIIFSSKINFIDHFVSQRWRLSTIFTSELKFWRFSHCWEDLFFIKYFHKIFLKFLFHKIFLRFYFHKIWRFYEIIIFLRFYTKKIYSWFSVLCYRFDIMKIKIFWFCAENVYFWFYLK